MVIISPPLYLLRGYDGNHFTPVHICLNIPHADSADLADFLIRYYYVVHECTIDLRNLRNQRGKEIFSVDIPTHISQISQISIQMLLCSA